MKISLAQRAVLEMMNHGALLMGSGIGGVTLLDGGRIAHAISAQTHGALIRKGLVCRPPGVCSHPDCQEAWRKESGQ